MENEWKSYSLGEICSYSKERINIQDVTNKNYISTENMFPDKGGITEAATLPNVKSVSRYEKGDTLISNIRPYFKKIWFSNKIGGASNDVLVIKGKSEKVFNKYLYYFLTQDKFFDYVMGTSKGTKMPRGDKDAILKYDIKLPPLYEQKAIAKVLSDLDEKIEVNNKINKKLEEMAQTIFKQWFVDFEFPNEDGKPYKSSGGEMVESELGMIPNGWRVKLLKDYCDVKKGLSYKGKHLVEDGVPMINLGNVNPGGGFRSDKCKFYDGDFKEQHTVKAGDIIIANTDMTQDRVILGSPILVPDFKTESIIFTHHLFAFRNLKIPKSFLYYYLKSKSFRERAESYATGTTVLAISRDSVLNINFVKANNEVLNKFDLITKSILDRIKNNNLEIEKLQKLRDTLLPKLMSGEIRVPIN